MVTQTLRQQAEQELTKFFKTAQAQRTDGQRQDARLAQQHISSAINDDTSARANSGMDRQWQAFQFQQVQDLLSDPAQREEYLRLSAPDHPYLKLKGATK